MAIAGLAAAARIEVIARRDGAAMFAAIGLWAIARFLVAFTWRDPGALGPLRMEQLLDVGLIAVAGLGLLERARAPLEAPVEPRVDVEARLA